MADFKFGFELSEDDRRSPGSPGEGLYQLFWLAMRHDTCKSELDALAQSANQLATCHS